MKKIFSLYFIIIFLFSIYNLFAGEFVHSGVSWQGNWNNPIIDFDLNGDRLTDLIFLDYRNFYIYYQRKGEGFLPNPDFSINIPEPYAHFYFSDVTDDNAEEIVLLSKDGVFYDTLKEKKDKLTPTQIINISLPIIARFDHILPVPFIIKLTKNSGKGILLPQENKFVFFVQKEKGEFIKKWEIPNPEYSKMNFSISTWQASLIDEGNPYYHLNINNSKVLSGVSFKDINSDGLIDVTCGDNIYIQQKDGSLVNHTAPFISEEDDFLGDSQIKKGILVGKEIKIDVDGDEILDLVKFNVEKMGFKLKTTVKIFLGKKVGQTSSSVNTVVTPTSGRHSFMDDSNNFIIKYSKDPKVSLVVKGFPVGMRNLSFTDLNGDGALDLVFFNIETEASSITSQMKAFVERGLDGVILFYLWEKGKGYSDRPTLTKTVQVSFEIYGLQFFVQNLLLYDKDFTGDGLPDLVLKTSKQKIEIFPFLGVQSGRFSKQPITLISSDPIDDMKAKDINNDGISDLIVKCFSRDNPDILVNNFFISH